MSDTTITAISRMRAFAARVQTWFPEREFFMRSDGQVRFIRISSRVQMIAATAVVALVIGWAASLAIMAWNQYRAEANLASFEQEKARIATKEERLKAYGDNLDQVVDDLNARQQVLDSMLPMLPKEIRESAVNVTDSSSEAAETVEKVGALFPEARGLAEIEARQLAFVEDITRYADWRAKKAERAMQKLNLDPRAMTRAEDRSAMGGPFVPLEPGMGELDPRFERMEMSLARMAALERALQSIPQVAPASDQRITSNYGPRRDPFNRRRAMHYGIDFKGPHGSPIYAAAMGRVTFAGWKRGFGKTVEIRHGKSMLTRYAHLSRLDAKVGDEVAAGETIGGLGSTGRSTGPHLHFEVRINNRAVDPRHFLETAPDVLKEARRTTQPRP